MSLKCLTCHSVESPSHSFRSYSVSSSDNDGRCSAIANCLARRSSLIPTSANPCVTLSSKVTPQPTIPSNNGMPGTPRLVRSRAVRRDLVRDWNFDEVVVMERWFCKFRNRKGTALFSYDRFRARPCFIFVIVFCYGCNRTHFPCGRVWASVTI